MLSMKEYFFRKNKLPSLVLKSCLSLHYTCLKTKNYDIVCYWNFNIFIILRFCLKSITYLQKIKGLTKISTKLCNEATNRMGWWLFSFLRLFCLSCWSWGKNLDRGDPFFPPTNGKTLANVRPSLCSWKNEWREMDLAINFVLLSVNKFALKIESD